MSHNFSTEYENARKAIHKGAFPADKEVTALVEKLKKLLGTGGFHDTGSDALDALRKHVVLGSSAVGKALTGKSADEAARVLDMGGAYAVGSTASDKERSYTSTDALTQRLGALKLLRHSHFISKTGAKSLWVISVPQSYRKWPGLELKDVANNEAKLKDRLGKVREYFSGTHKKHMHEGALLALRWVQQTLLVIGKAGKDKGEAMDLVKRWFETTDTDAKDLKALTAELKAGFKKIQAVLNGNRLIFTDDPTQRGTDDEKNTEAFVYSGAWADSLKVVYIEKGFFARGGNVLSGKENWARIIIHELSHSQLNTDDYPPDNSYGWQGINPADPKFKGNKARSNAENWAYFAADCAAALSKGERGTALRLP